ncbi:MAG: ABC transporter permease [Actinomycetota bacterium]
MASPTIPRPTLTGRRVGNGDGYGVLFWLSAGWIVLILFVAVFGDLLPLKDPNRINPADKLRPIFSDGAILGTDQLGRDLLARLVSGARISVFISVASVTVGIVVGGLIGTAVGFYRGRIERVVMAIVNIMLSFPALVLLLGVVAMAGSSLTVLTSVFCVLAIPGYVRFARASTLSLMQRDWVLVSMMIGSTSRRVILRILMPEVLITLITFGLLALGGVIVAEGTIAFLGFGVPPPQATWGSMIAEGKNALDETLNLALVPATVMFLTILSLNLVGDGLRRKNQARESQI